MKVTLISTVKDCADGVDAFLASLAGQTRAPDEVVIVDGGSTDGTAERFAADDTVTLIVEPGANIARGRNVALAAATHDVIAVTDADCILEPRWLAEIIAPIEAGADVSMGFYEAQVDGFLQACMASVTCRWMRARWTRRRSTRRPDRWPYRRDAIETVGGYPEWLAIGEDMWVDLRWRERPRHAVRARRRGALAAPAFAHRDVAAVLPVRTRRRAGRDASGPPRRAVSRPTADSCLRSRPSARGEAARRRGRRGVRAGRPCGARDVGSRARANGRSPPSRCRR